MVRGMNESQSEISNSRRQSLNGRGNNLYSIDQVGEKYDLWKTIYTIDKLRQKTFHRKFLMKL